MGDAREPVFLEKLLLYCQKKFRPCVGGAGLGFLGRVGV